MAPGPTAWPEGPTVKGHKAPSKPTEPVGRRAFEAQLAFLEPKLFVGENSAEEQEFARVFSLARQWVDAGDYLAAVHALGDLEMRITSKVVLTGSPAFWKPADVEQALGDLRRAIKADAERPATAHAQALWSAAREEVIRGSWSAAMALIKEANERLAKEW
jgi:hypothetical protein